MSGDSQETPKERQRILIEAVDSPIRKRDVAGLIMRGTAELTEGFPMISPDDEANAAMWAEAGPDEVPHHPV